MADDAWIATMWEIVSILQNDEIQLPGKTGPWGLFQSEVLGEGRLSSDQCCSLFFGLLLFVREVLFLEMKSMEAENLFL